jgi:hypothetical protein
MCLNAISGGLVLVGDRLPCAMVASDLLGRKGLLEVESFVLRCGRSGRSSTAAHLLLCCLFASASHASRRVCCQGRVFHGQRFAVWQLTHSTWGRPVDATKPYPCNSYSSETCTKIVDLLLMRWMVDLVREFWLCRTVSAFRIVLSRARLSQGAVWPSHILSGQHTCTVTAIASFGGH